MLAVLESNTVAENAERILSSMKPSELIGVIKRLTDSDNDIGSENKFRDILSKLRSFKIGEIMAFLYGESEAQIISVSASEQNSREDELESELGQNLYILAHQLAMFNKEFANQLYVKNANHPAIEFYASSTAQIEVNLSFLKSNVLLGFMN